MLWNNLSYHAKRAQLFQNLKANFLLFAVSLMLEYEQCFKYICFYSLKVEQALVQMRM